MALSIVGRVGCIEFELCDVSKSKQQRARTVLLVQSTSSINPTEDGRFDASLEDFGLPAWCQCQSAADSRQAGGRQVAGR